MKKISNDIETFEMPVVGIFWKSVLKTYLNE